MSTVRGSAAVPQTAFAPHYPMRHLLEALLNSWRCPVAVCDLSGLLTYHNLAARKVLGLRETDAGSSLLEGTTANQVRFLRALERLRASEGVEQHLELQLGGKRLPVRMQFLDERCCWLRLVFLSARFVAADNLSSVYLRYGFTPAEQAVASELVKGKSAADIAALRGSARETVRSQIKSLLQKTGTTRQAELIALLCAKSLTA